MTPLFKPFMPELPELNEILHSGSLAAGRYTHAFEDRLKAYFGTPYIVTTNSFNTAISVALGTLNIGFGDEVIASPMACLASTQPYLSSGVKVCWADVDPERGTLNPDSVRKQITAKTKAIIHNHFCGYPGYIDEINQIGFEHGIPVIDDGIECFGSKYKDKLIGNCGTNVTVFSCNPVRIPNTIDGGIVIFADKELYERAILIRDCGIDRSRFRDELGEINPECDIEVVGYSATMSNVNGYIGLKQMEKIDLLIDRQKLNARLWSERLDNNKYMPLQSYGNEPNYWVYGILTDNKRKAIEYFRANGYNASGVHMKNSVYAVFGKQDVELKGVDKFYDSFVALPCGWWVEEISYA